MPRSFLARPRAVIQSSNGSTGCLRLPASGAFLRRAGASGAPALRAGAGVVLLLGVTAAVRGMTDTESPAARQSTEFAALRTVPAVDPLGNAALRQETVAAAALVRAPAEDARTRAAQEAARSAARERAAAAKSAAEAQEALQVARAQAARAQAAREAAARAAASRAAAKAAAARAEKARPTPATAPSGDPRSIARQLLAARGWSGQFGCLNALWQRESGWNPRALNASSGAYGIPQALPAGKMSSAGADWRTNPGTQIRWGLSYIASTYGAPCAAWGHSQSHGWY